MNGATQADARITANRRELKFRVPPSRARTIAAEVARFLPEHRFTGPGANRLPGARHFVTTVYFDTERHELYDAALRSAGSLKIRAKEYYDHNVGLTELARSKKQLVHSSPILWVELKESVATRSTKRRVGIPKEEVAEFFATGEISEQMLEIQRQVYADESSAVLGELLEVCRRFDTPLRPSALVNYRRTAWQDPEGSVRVTIDRDLAFFRATEDTWPRSPLLERAHLGPKIGFDPEYIVEVKSVGTMPSWLRALLLDQAGYPVRTSKFIAAMEAVIRITDRGRS